MGMLEHGPFSENGARMLFSQVCKAIVYLHENEFAHLDIKPDNILLDSSRTVAVLSDFGSCIPFTSGEPSTSNCGGGTFFYSAPEVLRRSLEIREVYPDK